MVPSKWWKQNKFFWQHATVTISLNKSTLFRSFMVTLWKREKNNLKIWFISGLKERKTRRRKRIAATDWMTTIAPEQKKKKIKAGPKLFDIFLRRTTLAAAVALYNATHTLLPLSHHRPLSSSCSILLLQALELRSWAACCLRCVQLRNDRRTKNAGLWWMRVPSAPSLALKRKPGRKINDERAGYADSFFISFSLPCSCWLSLSLCAATLLSCSSQLYAFFYTFV